MTRLVAHITIEADTPLKVGSNASDFLQDSPIQKDWNSLPMILGTSIAGVLRKEFHKSEADILFGFENGSKVIFSNALLMDEHSKVAEELLLKKSDFLQIFQNLPIREHAVINHKGVAENKFDEEVVYKGSRFKFSIEIIEDDTLNFEKLLELLVSSSFRLGGGSTKGFGKFKIHEIKTQKFTKDTYKHYESSLNSTLKTTFSLEENVSQSYTKYLLKIQPEDFFMFGSGFGDEDADATPVYEQVIDYNKKNDDNTIGGLTQKQILIPASSIKGALAHRTAFYYNKYCLENGKEHTKIGEENDAINIIFGHKKELAEDKKTELGHKGKLILSDCFQDDKEKTQTFDHVSIDRFTGGAIDGALFQEKTIAQKDMWEIEILLHEDVQGEELKAFEEALIDITTGMLPLGGMTTKGHGVFVGRVLKNGKELQHD